MNIKIFIPHRVPSKKWCNNPQKGRKHLQITYMICLTYKIYKELLQLTNKKAFQLENGHWGFPWQSSG